MIYTDLLPKIIGKESTKEFNPDIIYNSLLKETTINNDYALKITNNVCRFLIVNNLQLITAPLIREIVNIELIKLGLEKERLQYTRIGFPYFDLIKMTKKFNIHFDYSKNLLLRERLINGILKEFNEVKKLIEGKL